MKKYIIIAVIALILAGSGWIGYTQYVKLKNENERLTRNIEVLNSEVETGKTLNGQLTFSNQSLTIKSDELKSINSSLVDEVKNMKLKLKNLQSIIEVKGDIIQKIDTIPTKVKVDLTANKIGDLEFEYSDEFTTINGEISIPDGYIYNLFKSDNETINVNIIESFKSKNPMFGVNGFNNELDLPYIYNLNYKIKNDLIIANEFQYKRRWIFWKKVVGVKVHIKSNNPNININTIKSFQIK